jgi:hypothetical protein
MLENPPEPQLPERRPVGRPRKIEDIEELHRIEQLAQLQLAARIRQFTEKRLTALEKGIEDGSLTKMDFESFKVAVSANVEAAKLAARAAAERPPEQPKDDFNIDAFLKGQE